MPIANHDSVNELITRHLAGETTADEEKALAAWMHQSVENREHYNRLKKTFDVTTSYVKIPSALLDQDVDVEAEWARFQTSAGERRKTRQMQGMGLWMKIAASFLLLIAAGAILFYYLKSEPSVYETAENTETVTLPDGSRIVLNRNSVLSIDADYGDGNRMVTLQGEAFFEVTPDQRNPFLIQAANTRVRVIGTSFNVNAYDSLETVEVVVNTGIVSVQPADGKPAELLPGERGVVSKSDNRMSIVVNDDVNYLSWNTQHLVFVDEGLPSVLRTLERTYNAKITVNTDIAPSCIVTVTFYKQSLASVMRVLENTLNITYTIQGNNVEITEAGC